MRSCLQLPSCSCCPCAVMTAAATTLCCPCEVLYAAAITFYSHIYSCYHAPVVHMHSCMQFPRPCVVLSAATIMLLLPMYNPIYSCHHAHTVHVQSLLPIGVLYEASHLRSSVSAITLLLPICGPVCHFHHASAAQVRSCLQLPRWTAGALLQLPRTVDGQQLRDASCRQDCTWAA